MMKRSLSLVVASVVACVGFAAETVSFHDGVNGYRVTDMSNVLIQAGSALDLTEAGSRGDRWLGFVAGWWQVAPLFERDAEDYGGDWKKAFDEYAVQVRRQGFNFFRFHGLLDQGYRGLDQFDVPSADYMDKVDYLAYTLGKHGVRLYVDLVAYGMRYPKRERKNIDLKAGVLFGVPRYLAQWEKCVRAVLGHYNPYTGRKWKDDENIVAVCQFNEQSTGAKIGLEAAWKGLDPETKAFFLANWKAWMVKDGRASEAQMAEFSADKPLPAFYEPKGFGRDMHLYLSELAVERTKWYDRICHEAGYKGLRTSFNSNVDWGACAARWSAGDAVPYNVHQGHPHGGGHGYKGARVDCNDAFQRTVEGSCFCYGNRIKAADRPFIVTEFSHAFWNPNRYEVGLITAYHALNGYKGVLWHAGGTQLKATGEWPRGRVGVFELGTSPCMRAAAFLSSCLYLRGDVKTSEKRVTVAVTKDYWQKHSADAPSSSQARIGLVCNYGIEFLDLPRTPGLGAYPKSDLTIAPGMGDEVENGLWVSNVKGKGMGDFDMDAFVAKLKAKGLVSPENRTDAKKGVYESETGELLMKGYDHYLQVVTPRTEAVCLETGMSARLDKMEVRSTSVNACVAVTSVDGEPIGASKRMVFLYITREANEGMVTSADGKTMVEMGAYPALLQTGAVEVRFALAAKDWQVYLLGYNGERLDRLPVQSENGRLVLKLDTAKVRHGPTPFFEFVKGKDQNPVAVYHFAEDGSDANDGLSPARPLRTIGRLNALDLKPGDCVLFRRGDLFRGAIKAKSGVTYAAYGAGTERPTICASKRDYADPKLWVKTDEPNVWRCTQNLHNVGIVLFDREPRRIDGTPVVADMRLPKRKEPYDKPVVLDADLTFRNLFHEDRLELRSDTGNPGERFSHIEIGEHGHCLWINADDLLIEGLHLTLSGSHGVGGSGDCRRNVTVRNCQIDWLGGSIIEGWRFGTVRFGNAIEIWGGCDGFQALNNRISNVYDTGVTIQCNDRTNLVCKMENVLFASNVIDNCFWGLEYYNKNNAPGSFTRNVRFVGNCCRGTGRGWGCKGRERRAPAISIGETPVGSSENLIEGNLFLGSTGPLVTIREPVAKGAFAFRGNHYAQCRDGILLSHEPVRKSFASTAEITDMEVIPFTESSAEVVRRRLGDESAKTEFLER